MNGALFSAAGLFHHGFPRGVGCAVSIASADWPDFSRGVSCIVTHKPKDFLFDYVWRYFPQDVAPPPAERLWTFLEFLQREARHFNLTAIHDTAEMVTRHLIDSLAPLAQPDLPIDTKAALRVLDVGSGNGVPGLVVAIVFPHWNVSLLESNGKKVEFLREAAKEAGATNVEVIQGRAEVVARDATRRDGFDLVIARALAMLPTTLELCLPFVKPDGWFLAYKGFDCEKEIEVSRHAFGELKGELVMKEHYPLEPSSLIHTALWIRKSGPTPGAYPRRDGLPKKRPLWLERGAMEE